MDMFVNAEKDKPCVRKKYSYLDYTSHFFHY
jgi:hypothetical protein